MWYRLPWMIAFVCVATQLRAQDVRVKVATQDPPLYVGDPVIVQFTVQGFDQQPEPTCTIETENGQPVAGLRGQMGGARASAFSQIVNRNGQLYQTQRITYTIQYLVTADRPGDFQVGPFLIKQGNKEARVPATSMIFEDVPADPDMRVRLRLPDTPVYPDQRVPIAVEWWYAGDFDNVLKLSIYAPLFDQFRFAPDEQPSRRATQLPIDTKDGRMALAATAREEEVDGRQFTVLSAQRTLIPDRVGEYALAPITATVRKATAWSRSRSLPVRAVGEPQTLVVKPFPIEGRPESFAGAVGTGFAIKVAADRTVVRVGDPIALNISLRGDGNIERASLPTLSADGGMDPDLFRLPEGDTPGTLADGAKRFRVSVRVADESVAEIPSLAYSWFDPADETYRTARSKPIALRVMPAQVISSSDVVRNDAKPATANGTKSNERDAPDVALAPSNRPVFSLSGADLAIEPNAGVLLRDSSGFFGSALVLQTAVYAAGLLLVLVALADRSRREVDPVLKARRKTISQQQSRIARAASRPPREAAEEIAAAMRALVAEAPGIDRDEAQAVTAACESIVYAPDVSNHTRLDEALIERARKVSEVVG